MQKQYYPAIGFAKFIFSIFIIGQHTQPLFEESFFNTAARILFTVAVPFFFFCAGFFLSRGLDSESVFTKKRIAYFLRIAVLYIVFSFVYLPLVPSMWFADAPINCVQIMWFVKERMLFGCFEHLWYLYALFFGGLIYLLLVRFLKIRAVTLIAVICYTVGVVFHNILPPNEEFKYSVWIGVQSVLFSAFPMITFGGALSITKRKMSKKFLLCIGVISLFGYFTELRIYSLLPDRLALQMFFIPLLVAIVFALLCKLEIKKTNVCKVLQSASTWNYLIHMWIILAPQHIFGLNFSQSGWKTFLMVSLFSSVLSILFALAESRLRFCLKKNCGGSL